MESKFLLDYNIMWYPNLKNPNKPQLVSHNNMCHLNLNKPL